MESTMHLNMQGLADERQLALNDWLQSLVELPPFTLIAMQGDASFRRYFRVATSNGSFVAMDAPPVTENCRPFVAIAQALRDHHLQAPQIIAANVEQGFLLLQDFGDLTLLKALNEDNADTVYRLALKTLAVLQSCPNVSNHALPFFNREFMLKEWSWFKEWVLEKWLGLKLDSEHETLLDACYDRLIQSAESQPQVFMHRDFHSANLMLVDATSENTDLPPSSRDLTAGTSSIAILDFQDAFIGPITYDAVSLLRDCYINWPNDKIENWVEFYREQLLAFNATTATQQAFLVWFDLMGMQRHLKALLTFARKKVRDNQPQYLAFVPRTLNYLLDSSAKYSDLQALHVYLKDVIQPATARMLACAR